MSVYLPPDAAAHYAQVQVKTLRAWVRRGHISEMVRGCYDMEEIAAYQLDGAEARLARAIHARGRRGETRRGELVACEPLGL